MQEEFSKLEIDQIILNLEQIDDQLTNLLSLSEELGDLSHNLNKFVQKNENTQPTCSGTNEL